MNILPRVLIGLIVLALVAGCSIPRYHLSFSRVAHQEGDIQRDIDALQSMAWTETSTVEVTSWAKQYLSAPDELLPEVAAQYEVIGRLKSRSSVTCSRGWGDAPRTAGEARRAHGEAMGRAAKVLGGDLVIITEMDDKAWDSWDVSYRDRLGNRATHHASCADVGRSASGLVLRRRSNRGS